MVTAAMHNNFYHLAHYRQQLPVNSGKAIDSVCRNFQNSELYCHSDREFVGPDHSIYRGQIMGNKYAIQALLGRGSFGQVVLAREIGTSREVAVKILGSKKSAQSVLLEVNTLKYLNKNDPENLFVRFFGDFIWRDFHCLVFELLGENLYDYLKHRQFTGMPFQDVVDIAVQLISALAHLCVLNIVHCDIKPENIAFIRGGRNIKLIDFGSSCSNGKTVYRYIQSRFYRAVEVILELGYDFKIDTWSVGCVLAELLTGSPLFPGNNELEQLVHFTQVLGMIPYRLALSSPKFSHFFFLRDQIPVLKTFGKVVSVASPSLLNILQASSSVRAHIETHPTDFFQQQRVLLLLDLIARMIIYDPRLRALPRDLLSHPIMPQNLSPLCLSGRPSSHSLVPFQMVSPVCLDSHFGGVNYMQCEPRASYQGYNQFMACPVPCLLDYPYPVQVQLAPTFAVNRPTNNHFMPMVSHYLETSGVCSCSDCSLVAANTYHYINLPKHGSSGILY